MVKKRPKYKSYFGFGLILFVLGLGTDITPFFVFGLVFIAMGIMKMKDVKKTKS